MYCRIILALQFSCDKVTPKLPFLPIQPLSCFIRSVAYQSFAKFISSTQRIMYFLLKHIFCAGVRYKYKQTDLVLWSSLFLMEWYLANSVKQLWQLFRFWDSSGSGVNLSKMKKKKTFDYWQMIDYVDNIIFLREYDCQTHSNRTFEISHP